MSANDPSRPSSLELYNVTWKVTILVKLFGDFVEKDFVLSPEGARLDSPGQRPGDQVPIIVTSPNGAQQGGAIAAPFQGYNGLGTSSPRAAPWAIESRPFGAEATVS